MTGHRVPIPSVSWQGCSPAAFHRLLFRFGAECHVFDALCTAAAFPRVQRRFGARQDSQPGRDRPEFIANGEACAGLTFQLWGHALDIVWQAVANARGGIIVFGFGRGPGSTAHLRGAGQEFTTGSWDVGVVDEGIILRRSEGSKLHWSSRHPLRPV